MSSPSSDRDRRAQKVNRWAAVIVPLILIAIVAWASYIVIVKVAVDRYLAKSSGRDAGDGVAVIVVYCLVLALTALCYLRLLVTIWYNPGYMPRRAGSGSGNTTTIDGSGLGSSPLLSSKHAQATGGHKHQGGLVPDYRNRIGDGTVTFAEERLAAKMKNLDSFRPRQLFLVDGDGLPRWCLECACWKPDRTHHCSDLGRVGGIVSETTMKFFLQFTFYASLLSLIVLVVTALSLTQDNGDNDAQLIAAVAVAAVFFVFAIGIFGNTFAMLITNRTTVESLGKTQSYAFAVLITPDWYPHDTSGPQKPFPFDVKTFPAAPDALYGIMSTRPGENPWDLGAWRNVGSVMGKSVRQGEKWRGE
ncbi:hypothetical protein K490DRAFT_58759 [Saccharata proteae CBS 121410]|uniref:protein S-acyltransferase n=1 Tax=Saccharata proteae CBS 121410 TaxID=1314787 RepID=A0A9P4LVI2_9PEZI|nr:hypothetical protein K490DRAFT_58759 [Saccharata proteae CBS 121410]